MTQTDPNIKIEQKPGYSVEELQVMGEQLLAKVKELVHEGNVRRIIIKHEGQTIVEIPLTFGLAGVILAPVWAAVGVLGALLARCSIEVIRMEKPDGATSVQPDEAAADEVPPYL
jgi:hypothetical protein